MLGRKKFVSFDVFSEVEHVELERELAFSATFFFWAKACCEGKRDKSMHEAWNKQVFEARSWNDFRCLAGAVCCKVRDVDIQWQVWDVLSVDGKCIDCRIMVPSVDKTHP